MEQLFPLQICFFFLLELCLKRETFPAYPFTRQGRFPSWRLHLNLFVSRSSVKSLNGETSGSLFFCQPLFLSPIKPTAKVFRRPVRGAPTERPEFAEADKLWPEEQKQSVSNFERPKLVIPTAKNVFSSKCCLFVDADVWNVSQLLPHTRCVWLWPLWRLRQTVPRDAAFTPDWG